MAKNNGKIFEEDFRKSLDLNNPDLFYYRFKDGTANWTGNQLNDNIRFQHKNICDCMIFHNGKLILCELKSHHGKSLPFSCIRKNQFEELSLASIKKNVYCFIIIYFSDIEECYAVPINAINSFRAESTSKSIPLLLCQEKGLKIECRKLISRHKFDILKFLDELK